MIFEYNMTVDTDFNPPKVTVLAKAQPPPPPLPPSTGVYQVVGGMLKDPLGADHVVRGWEQMYWQTDWISSSFINEQAKTGANTSRILPVFETSPPAAGTRNTTTQIEDMIKRCVNTKMLADVAIDGGKRPSVYTRTDIKTILKRYEYNIVLHASGESGAGDDATWVSQSKATIKLLRDAGYTCPLYILTNHYGRNLPTLIRKAEEVLASDPLRNIVFGWQAYWGTGNYYQNQYGLTLAQAITEVVKLRAKGVCVQVGLLKHSDQQNAGDTQTVPYMDLMGLCEANRIGWLWWDWRMSVDDVTTNGMFGSWTDLRDVYDGPYGVLRTSKKTPYLQGLKAV